MEEVKRTLDDYGWIKYTVKSPKVKATYTVSKKENGFSQYVVSISKGVVPEALRGSFTTPDVGLEAVLKYLRNVKPSAAVKRDENSRRSIEWKEKNAAKRKADNQEHVQQGTAD